MRYLSRLTGLLWLNSELETHKNVSRVTIKLDLDIRLVNFDEDRKLHSEFNILFLSNKIVCLRK
jgi:hypothetical protein